MIDLACTLALLSMLATVGVAYAARVARHGAQRNGRVDQAGSSALLGKGLMEAGYWGFTPVARALSALGVTANGVTLFSLVLGIAGAVALAAGRFGVGALLTGIAAVCDALDGIIARQTGTASDAGEVFDAAVDRYQEFFFLAALAVYFRADAMPLVLSLLALLGSFMVSYGTAKAEALQVPSPRGAMRRAERAVYLGAGVLLVPVTQALVPRFGLPPWVGHAPILVALALVGVVGNVSAARRLAAIARSVAERDASRGAVRPPMPAADEDAAHDALHQGAR